MGRCYSVNPIGFVLNSGMTGSPGSDVLMSFKALISAHLCVVSSISSQGRSAQANILTSSDSLPGAISFSFKRTAMYTS